MTWSSLQAVRNSVLEFSKESGLREAHHFVKLPSGKWTRTLGPPQGAKHLYGRVWEVLP